MPASCSYLGGGEGSEGPKRDPWARELEFGDFHDTDCIVRAPESYPWDDAGFVRPRFNDLIVYQFHVGVFTATDDTGRDRRPGRVAKFLEALDRIEYLADLGVNAVQPLPFVEFRTPWSQGYNGTDIFSPEMDYCVGPDELPLYLKRANTLLARKGCPPLTQAQLTGQVNQLKAFIDICHSHRGRTGQSAAESLVAPADRLAPDASKSGNKVSPTARNSATAWDSSRTVRMFEQQA